MWNIIRQWVADWNMTSILIRLVMAWVIGFLIGIDREYKQRTVGVRTHVLVCVGTALATMTASYAQNVYPASNIDITRLGGQMIAGIGFLGAGAILVTKRNRIMGLTTAAGLWVCACSGLAIGFGFFEGAIITVILVVITQLLLPVLEKYLHRSDRMFDLYLEFGQGQSLSGLLRLLNSEDVSYSDFHIIRDDDGKEGPILTVNVRIRKQAAMDAFLSKVRELEGLEYMSQNYLQ